MTRTNLRYAARSDVGLVRQGNEDSGYAGGHMLIVADGMGGHAAGELASATAVATLAELDCNPPGDDVLAALADAVEDAHEQLAGVISSSPDFAGMGTTVTALAWLGDRIAIAHIGDSRAYLLRGSRLYQLTADHTFVQALVDTGRITKEEAAVHHKRNLLVKALDGVHSVEPDLSMRQVQVGDRYLLCTDGLSGVVPDAELARLLAHGDPTGAVAVLVDRALEAGAPDNVTCVVADVVTETAATTSAAEDLQSPVVVGAAAEPRNRDRLPWIEFPSDSQLDPDRIQPEARATPKKPEPATPKAIPRRRRALGWIAGAVAVIAIAVASFWVWAQNQYYVGEASGYMAIYRGVPVGFGPHGWSRAVETTNTAVTSLPYYSQEQIQQTIPASGLDGARNVVAALESQAVACQTPPIPPGCPQNPPPPPSVPPATETTG